MKSIITIGLLTALLSSCAQKAVVTESTMYDANLQNIAGIDKEENFSVKLLTKHGIEIKDYLSIQPNTSYKLQVVSENAAYFRIRYIDGFKILKNPVFVHPSEGGSPSREAFFDIMTNENIEAGIVFSITPLQIINGTLYRERAKNFLFDTHK